MSVKDQVHEIAENLPEEATLEDALYAMYVRMKFEKGAQQIREGKGISHEEVQKYFEAQWRK